MILFRILPAFSESYHDILKIHCLIFLVANWESFSSHLLCTFFHAAQVVVIIPLIFGADQTFAFVDWASL